MSASGTINPGMKLNGNCPIAKSRTWCARARPADEGAAGATGGRLFLAMFMGDGHIRGMLKLEPPGPLEDKALLREAVRVFLAAYGT